jgi:CheY-like chemotaxis protein
LEALFPQPRRLILGALFGEPERWFSLPELAGRAGVQPATVRQHLVALRDGGILREKVEGGRPWFQPDPASPVFAELQSMVSKLTAHAAGETILVVEDHPATAQITRILLESWGYRVLEARDGAAALGIYEAFDGVIQLLLADVIMPGMSGTQLADELLRRNPRLRVVLMSGYPAEQISTCNAAFLPKPFNPSGLSRTIRKELERTDRQQGRMNTP